MSRYLRACETGAGGKLESMVRLLEAYWSGQRAPAFAVGCEIRVLKNVELLLGDRFGVPDLADTVSLSQSGWSSLICTASYSAGCHGLPPRMRYAALRNARFSVGRSEGDIVVWWPCNR